jgi:hypothetical protein
MEHPFFVIKLVIAIIFGLVGIGIFSFSYYAYNKAKKALKWFTTNGTVLSSEVQKKTSDQSSISMMDRTEFTRRKTVTNYTPDVCYSYTVQSKEYVSNKVGAFNVGTSSSVAAYSVANRYKAGSTVKVYYNPENPAESMLEPGVKAIQKVFLVVGLIVIGFAFIILFLF